MRLVKYVAVLIIHRRLSILAVMLSCVPFFISGEAEGKSSKSSYTRSLSVYRGSAVLAEWQIDNKTCEIGSEKYSRNGDVFTSSPYSMLELQFCHALTSTVSHKIHFSHGHSAKYFGTLNPVSPSQIGNKRCCRQVQIQIHSRRYMSEKRLIKQPGGFLEGSASSQVELTNYRNGMIENSRV